MNTYHRSASKSITGVRARQSDALSNLKRRIKQLVAVKILGIQRIRGIELVELLRESGVSLEAFEQSIIACDDGLLRSTLLRGRRFSQHALAHARANIAKTNTKKPVIRRENSRAGSTRSFMSFVNSRHFEPVPVACKHRPVRRCYFALPMTMYESESAETAYKLVSEYAETIFDARKLFTDGFDWRTRCEGILNECDELYCFAPSDEISSGVLAEAAYMHSLGRSVHLLTWWPGSEPKFKHGGAIVQYANWDWQRTAFYRPPYHREPDYYPDDEPWDDEG